MVQKYSELHSRLAIWAAILCITVLPTLAENHGFGAIAPRVSEPDIQTAMTWWSPPRGVWTPVGWKNHLFRFNVLYNGTLQVPPAGVLAKPHTARYQGQDFQLSFYPGIDGALPPLPKEPGMLYKQDTGIGIQAWREDHETPVLRTDWPSDEGVIMREEAFGHLAGGDTTKTGIEPLYAWIRLSVAHVDPIRAPKRFKLAIQLTRAYVGIGGIAGPDDCAFLEVRPGNVALHDRLTSSVLAAGEGKPAGLQIEQEGKTRVRMMPGGAADLAMDNITSGVYRLILDFPVTQGASTDILVPMLAEEAETLRSESTLGYDGALAQADAFWSRQRKGAARIHTPEKYVNDAISRSAQLAQIISETNPDNGEVSLLSGTYGYDALWSTPTSMVSHMFLDLLGYHDDVVSYMKLYGKNQGTIRPPGPAYKLHPGYFSTPKTLTSIDWLSDHGAIMEALSRHALLTGDKVFIDEWTPALIKACDFIKDSCAITEHEGVKGLMPPANATDTALPTQAVWSHAWIYKGLATTVELLKKTHHARAGEFESFAAAFRTTFDAAFRRAAADQPQWTDPQGRSFPVLPMNLVPAPTRHIYDDAFLLDGGPLVLPWAGLMDAADPLMVSFADFFRVGPNTKLRGPRSNALSRPVLTHELSTCEPCYSWNIVNSWRTGDRARFLEGMYGLFTGAISPQVYTSCEHRHGMYGNMFATPLLTWCMRQAVLDDQLEPGHLHLLRLCPLAWISRAEETVFEAMPTQYGPVSLSWRLSENGKTLKVRFTPSWRDKPGHITLHVPPVDGLETVELGGTQYPAQPVIEM